MEHSAEKDATVEHFEYRVTGIPVAAWFSRRETDWTRSLAEAEGWFAACHGPHVRLERRRIVTTTHAVEVYRTHVTSPGEG